jgi:hypothetical protein
MSNPFKNQYTADGIGTDFVYSFAVPINRAVLVYETLAANQADEDADLVSDTLYTIIPDNPSSATSTGIVRFNTAPADQSIITITPDQATLVTYVFSNTAPFNTDNLNGSFEQEAQTNGYNLQNFLENSIRYNVNENDADVNYDNKVSPLTDKGFWRRIGAEIISQDYDEFLEEILEDLGSQIANQTNASADNLNLSNEVASNNQGVPYSGQPKRVDAMGNIILDPVINGFSAKAGALWSQAWAESDNIINDDYGNSGRSAKYWAEQAETVVAEAEIPIVALANNTTIPNVFLLEDGESIDGEHYLYDAINERIFYIAVSPSGAVTLGSYSNGIQNFTVGGMPYSATELLEDVYVASVAEARTITITKPTRVHIDSYYGNGGLGGGVFLADLSDLSTPDDGGLVLATFGGQRIKRVLTKNLVQTSWFGAIKAGDVTTELQAAIDSGFNVLFDAADYEVSGTGLLLQYGRKYSGSTGGRFSSSQDHTTSIINNDVGGAIFRRTDPADFNQLDAPAIFDMKLTADFPIEFNEITRDVVDGSSATQPYLLAPIIERCSILPRVSGIGYGIQWTKCFDGQIANCNFGVFDISVIFLGCDLCLNENNRYTGYNTSMILDIGINTFGSQNIHGPGNDYILEGVSAQNDTSALIIANRHAIVRYGSYFECKKIMKCVVDLTSDNIPQIFGVTNNPLVGLNRFTIEVDANRIDDGGSFVQTSQYLLDFQGSLCRLNSSYNIGASIADSLSVNADGLPVRFSFNKGLIYDISAEGWGDLKTTEKMDGVWELNPNTVTGLRCKSIQFNNFYQHMRVTTGSVRILTTRTGSMNLYFFGEDSNVNDRVASTSDYLVTLYMRTTSGSGDTFSIGGIVDGALVGSTSPYAIDQTFKKYTFSLPSTVLGGVDSSSDVGIFFTGFSTNGVIEISSIKVTEV